VTQRTDGVPADRAAIDPHEAQMTKASHLGSCSGCTADEVQSLEYQLRSSHPRDTGRRVAAPADWANGASELQRNEGVVGRLMRMTQGW